MHYNSLADLKRIGTDHDVDTPLLYTLDPLRYGLLAEGDVQGRLIFTYLGYHCHAKSR